MRFDCILLSILLENFQTSAYQVVPLSVTLLQMEGVRTCQIPEKMKAH